MRLRNRRPIAAKLPLNGLAEVLQQMKTISDLPRLRRALTRGLRIEAEQRKSLTAYFSRASLTQVDDALPAESDGGDKEGHRKSKWSAFTMLLNPNSLTQHSGPDRLDNLR